MFRCGRSYLRCSKYYIVCRTDLGGCRLLYRQDLHWTWWSELRPTLAKPVVYKGGITIIGYFASWVAKWVNRSTKIQQFFTFHSIEKNAKIFAFFAKFFFSVLRKNKCKFLRNFFYQNVFTQNFASFSHFFCLIHVRKKVRNTKESVRIFLQKSVVRSKLCQAEKLWSGNGVPLLDQGPIGQSLASWIELN